MTTIIRNPSACCGTNATPTLRRFELTAAKTSTSPTATAKFLDNAGNMVGDPVTLYDPMGKFYGKPASYYGSGQGFRGVALQRTDLGGIEVDRWEIVEMEGFAESVLVTWVDASPTHEWQLTSFFGDHWEWKRPVNDNAPLTIDDPTGIGSAKQNGDKGIAHLKDPDTSPPTYELRTLQGLGATQIFALDPTNPCTLTLEDNKLVLKLHGKKLSIPARLIEDNVDKTCDIGAVVCGEVA